VPSAGGADIWRSRIDDATEPTDYDEVLLEVRRETVNLLKLHESSDARYFIGTPQTQTGWFSLGRGGQERASRYSPRR